MTDLNVLKEYKNSLLLSDPNNHWSLYIIIFDNTGGALAIRGFSIRGFDY